MGTFLASGGLAAAAAGVLGAAVAVFLRPRLEGKGQFAFLPPAIGFVLGVIGSFILGQTGEEALAGGVNGGLCANLLFTLYGQCLSRQKLAFMPSDPRVLLVAGLLTKKLGYVPAKKLATELVPGLDGLESVEQKVAFVHQKLEAFPQLTEVERTNLCCLILGGLSFL